MLLGRLVLLTWLAALVLSAAAVGLHLARHRVGGLARALLCPVGGVLMFGLVSAYAGLQEGAWGWSSSGLWLALAVGALGVVLEVLGWRAVLRRRILAGQCRACGYDLAGLPVCPECGQSATPTS